MQRPRRPDPELDTDVDESILGVSISRQQTRLTSPRTPAVEKAQALDGQNDFFTDITGKPIAEETDVLVKADGGADAAPTKRPETTRSFLRSALAARRRASSGPEISLDSIQKALMAIPRKFSLTTSQQSPRQLAQCDKSTSPPPADPNHASSTAYNGDTPPRSLRRAISDDSLTVRRAFSQVSSLGDDSRFNGIHAQVNSRFKAIKDSWNERDLKLPSLPSSNIKLPSIASLRSDLFGTQSQDDLTLKQKQPTDPLTRSPYHSVQAVAADMGEAKDTFSPHLSSALSQLEGDVVVLGGYRGSILRSATPPHKQLWVPIKVGLNLRKVDLEVGISPEDDMRDASDIIAGGMLTHIGPVDISKRLFKRLRTCEAAQQGRLRVHDYGYDWRLDPLFLSTQLCTFLEKLHCNHRDVPAHQRGATVIAHSLGGLITRHAVNHRPELFRGIVYAGVPTRCVNILGPLRNGDDVLLSSRVLTAQVNFTIRTSFALLPLDGRCFVDRQTHEEYPIDFFDPKTWLDNRLSPCIAPPLISLKPQAGIMSSVAKALPSAARKISISRAKTGSTSVEGIADPESLGTNNAYRQPLNTNADQIVEATVSTATTISYDEAYAYLERMLARVKRFKQELAFKEDFAEHNLYPPVAVIYGKNTPTVVGAKVDGRDGIQRADAYDDLAFGSGDGVVLARAAMLPEGYNAARGGIISSERGHVSLLGDLEAVGRAVNAIIMAKENGIGCGIAP